MVGVVVYFMVSHYNAVIARQKEIKEAELRYQRQLTDAVLTKIEEERSRIAGDLHDDFGAMWGVIKLNEQMIYNEANGSSKAMKSFEANKKILSDIKSKIRSIQNELVNPTLLLCGFETALKELCLSISGTGQISVTFSNKSTNIVKAKEVQVQLLRICSEIMTNLIKHSSPTSRVVNLFDVEGWLMIRFEHNGKGISTEEVKSLMQGSKGLGLNNIFSRVQMIKAKLDYHNDNKSLPFVELALNPFVKFYEN
jgi:signal transduction histidine kinase